MFRQRNLLDLLAAHAESSRPSFSHTHVPVQPLGLQVDNTDTMSEVDVLAFHQNPEAGSSSSQYGYDDHSADLFESQMLSPATSYSPVTSSSSSSSPYLPHSDIYADTHTGQSNDLIPGIGYDATPSFMPTLAKVFEPKIDFPVTVVLEDSATSTTADQKRKRKKPKTTADYFRLYTSAHSENIYFRGVITKVSELLDKSKKHTVYLNEQLRQKDKEIEKLTNEITTLKKGKRKRTSSEATPKNKFQRISHSDSRLQSNSIFSSPSVLFQPNTAASAPEEDAIPPLEKVGWAEHREAQQKQC